MIPPPRLPLLRQGQPGLRSLTDEALPNVHQPQLRQGGGMLLQGGVGDLQILLRVLEGDLRDAGQRGYEGEAQRVGERRVELCAGMVGHRYFTPFFSATTSHTRPMTAATRKAEAIATPSPRVKCP